MKTERGSLDQELAKALISQGIEIMAEAQHWVLQAEDELRRLQACTFKSIYALLLEVLPLSFQQLSLHKDKVSLKCSASYRCQCRTRKF